MTKEEYKENLIRMFDSLRTDCKGESACAGIRCADCPFYGKVCNATDTAMFMFHVHEAVEIVEQWVKEHPIATNADKFKEVFGFKPFTNNCINGEVKCKDCEYYDYGVCDAHNRFWNAEYNEKIKE